MYTFNSKNITWRSFNLSHKFVFSTFLCLVLFINSCDSSSQLNQDKEAITAILNSQAEAWSNNDIELFMEGYWRSDSLKFYGANGLTFGWQSTLENYKKRYPTKDDMGKLTFVIDDISNIENMSYSVMGQFHLERSIGNAKGVFMIIFKKINGEWKIIADLSC